MRQHYKWGPKDPTYLAMAPREIEREFWALYYWENYVKRGATPGRSEAEYDGSEEFAREMRERGIHIPGVTDVDEFDDDDPLWDDGEQWVEVDPDEVASG